jgi:anaerobic selenocysteine-containing dehydrogenase/Fe-S-cluster-containing dehydrogenase component
LARFSRRDFLKAACLGGATAVSGCSDKPFKNLIPYVIPPEDIVPGEATWYATTCRECPAGCGILAKNRDGHVVKVEGNPLHPVNGGKPWGKLCPRGQASLQNLYNPDRYPGPLKRNPDGRVESLTWEQAEQIFLTQVSPVIQKGRGERVVFLTELVTDARKDLIERWLAQMGSKGHVMYEPLAYEALRKANQQVFGADAIPTYRIDQADFLISFGANFLETWLSNVQYARQFSVFHELKDGGKNYFAYFGPRLSLTGANADLWVPVSPPCQSLVAQALLRAVTEGRGGGEGKGTAEPPAGSIPLDQLEQQTGVSAQTIRMLARKVNESKKPLFLAEGLGFSDPRATETAVAANQLCATMPESRSLLDFGDPSSLGMAAPLQRMRELCDRMTRGEIDVLLIDTANPLFHLPPAWGFQKALKAVPFIVTFSSAPDETSELAHLVLPRHTFYESWGDYSPRKSVRGLLQPTMGALFNSRQLENFLISTGKKLFGEKPFPWSDFYELLQESWSSQNRGAAAEGAWEQSLQRGGAWEEKPGEVFQAAPAATGSSSAPSGTPPAPAKGFHFFAYPTIQFYDGRSANRPFLQELPDPLTQVTWGAWIEINPETARQNKIEKGDVLRLTSPHGVLQAPAFPYPGIPANVLAMPLGHGHTNNGRYARDESGNPVQVIPPELDPASGGLVWAVSGVTLEKAGKFIHVANVDGSLYQHGRGLAQSVTLQGYRAGAEQKPDIDLPLFRGWNKEKDFYPGHTHDQYRWVMVVDLDRCIGCGACVVACYAENNVPWVGKEEVLKGRKASWLQIERYWEPEQPRVRFLPMLCQHCDAAPCESVCPVFAPHHSPEGINNQVYNRCIGTRFCSQNCPWKVRRFNWFTYSRPEPMHWMLNPDVTVRTKGVMEKCSFCIQRIVQAKVEARNQGRPKVRDEEFTTACAQTCPADVFTFGNLKDPESRVSKLIRDSRAYQVLKMLNTKPAVIYLKKITQDLKV